MPSLEIVGIFYILEKPGVLPIFFSPFSSMYASAYAHAYARYQKRYRRALHPSIV